MLICGPVLSEKKFSLHHVIEVKRTQQILLVFISIVLSICVISFFMVIYSLSMGYRTSTYEPIPILAWILFFASGLLVTQRFYPHGLLVFAWLGIVNMVLTCSIVVLITVGIVLITSQVPKPKVGILFSTTPIVVYLASVMLDAIIVILAFKLVYLIKKNEPRRSAAVPSHGLNLV